MVHRNNCTESGWAVQSQQVCALMSSAGLFLRVHSLSSKMEDTGEGFQKAWGITKVGCRVLMGCGSISWHNSGSCSAASCSGLVLRAGSIEGVLGGIWGIASGCAPVRFSYHPPRDSVNFPNSSDDSHFPLC